MAKVAPIQMSEKVRMPAICPLCRRSNPTIAPSSVLNRSLNAAPTAFTSVSLICAKRDWKSKKVFMAIVLLKMNGSLTGDSHSGFMVAKLHFFHETSIKATGDFGFPHTKAGTRGKAKRQSSCPCRYKHHEWEWWWPPPATCRTHRCWG